MGVGPVYAIPMALKNAGLQLGDVDLFEVSAFRHWCVRIIYQHSSQINEAFASQCVYVIKELGLPMYVNPRTFFFSD
jgi:acetyl-CoA acyltransferase 1